MAGKGLLIINTGNGKGKTTSALGLALRAAGNSMKVCIIQFIKGNKDTGEAKALARFSDLIEIHTLGSGFTWQARNPDEPRDAAHAAWKVAREKIAGNTFNMVILDEFTYALNLGYLEKDEVLCTILKRPPELHLVITGRDADADLMARADLVTEMREIKHPFQHGGKALRGIEF